MRPLGYTEADLKKVCRGSNHCYDSYSLRNNLYNCYLGNQISMIRSCPQGCTTTGEEDSDFCSVSSVNENGPTIRIEIQGKR